MLLHLGTTMLRMCTGVYVLRLDVMFAVDGSGEPCDERDLIATGDVQKAPSTRRGNVGGMSVQELYRDSAGRDVIRHIVYDSEGRVVHGPHFRPGGFK